VAKTKMDNIEYTNVVADVAIRRMVPVTLVFDIVTLAEPTKSGWTHAAIDKWGGVAGLLSKDLEGVWLYEFYVTGEVVSFIDK